MSFVCQQLIPRMGSFESLYYALDLNDPSCPTEMTPGHAELSPSAWFACVCPKCIGRSLSSFMVCPAGHLPMLKRLLLDCLVGRRYSCMQQAGMTLRWAKSTHQSGPSRHMDTKQACMYMAPTLPSLISTSTLHLSTLFQHARAQINT